MCHRGDSEWQPMVDLDSGVYLRTNRIELLSYLMILCPLPTFLPFHIASDCLPSEEFAAVRGGWGESCICAVQLLAVTSLGCQCPWAAFGVCFYTAQWAPGSSPLPQSSPSASPAPYFFSRNYFLSETSLAASFVLLWAPDFPISIVNVHKYSPFWLVVLSSVSLLI